MRLILRLMLVCCAAAQAATDSPPVQFSAALQEFTGEGGIVYHRLIFKDGKRTIYYQPPARWKCSVVNNRLWLVPPDAPFADAELSCQPIEGRAASDEAALEMFAQQSLGEAPPGSQQPTVVARNLNPILLDNNPSLEAVISFHALGEVFKRGVLVIVTPAHRLRVRLTAKKSDFDALYRIFRASVLTWEWQPEVVPNEQEKSSGAAASTPL